MAFLSDLGNIINEQFSFGENSSTSLDEGGDRMGNFGLLGDFAKKFDRSAERTYIEDGLINNIRPRMREVLFQEPDVTLVIKKKMFSSLIENSRLDLLEEKERLFIRASKKLFQNKLRLLSAYERLSKVERVSREAGQFNTSLVPMVLRDLAEFENAGFNFVDPQTRKSLDTLRRALTFSEQSNFSSWTVDFDAVFAGELGEGTGTFEITTLTNLNTTVSTEFGQGSCQFSIEDPYKILRVTQKDIDQAISDSQNFFKNSPLGRFTEIETKELIESQKAQLNIIRQRRAVSAIRFVVSPQSLISKRVRAIMEAEGREIQFTYSPGLVGLGGGVEIDETELEGVNALSNSEAQIFKEVISNIYLLLGYQNTTRSEIREFNQETNYARNRMRLMFRGKSIIQNMDVVNVFMTTKTTNDAKLTEGFPGFQTTGQLNIGQRVNNLLRNINTGIADLTGSKTSPDEIEKAAIVGPDFPTWLWRMFKNNFTKQGAGTCVFVGLVKSVNQKYDASSGRYTVSVSCEDNAGYFNKSQINIKPAINVFNSTLYDPLTPFDVSFDAATGKPTTDVTQGEFPPLLPENERLLQTRALKFKTTDFKGQNANQILYKTKKGEIVFGKLRRVLADADGFVYRWKQGINAITKIERADPKGKLSGENPVLLTAQPFAGQDVMNVLSLLVTGQPYNFNTFLQAALNNANDIMAYDPSSNEDTHASYIDGLIRELTARNVVWGNFVPFKHMSLNDEAYAFIRKGQADLTRRQSRLQSLLRQRAAKLDEKSLQMAGFESNDLRPLNDVLQGIDNEIAQLTMKIQKEQEQFSESESQLFSSKDNGTIKLVGDDISFEDGFDEFDGNNAVTQDQKSLSRHELRRKINTLAQRRLWKVKGNNDNNLFIVDDQYDKNYDIQAFERKIGAELKLFDSEYTTVDTKIKGVAEILGLEVFADSQGNIRVRPPLYNRMPSSVFYKMFKERDETGVKVFPDFLESLLFNQVESIRNRIEIVEDEIRLRATALGMTSDVQIRDFIRSGNSPSSADAVGFSFLTDKDTGRIEGDRIQAIPTAADPEARENFERQNIQALETLNNQATIQSQVVKAFDVVTRVERVAKENFSARLDTSNSDRIGVIRTRLKNKTGNPAKTEDQLFSNSRYRRIVGRKSEVEALNVVQQIANFVTERQRLAKELSNVTRNLREGLLINQGDAGAKQALTPFLNRKSAIPPMLEHMIEDETLDDLGPGSGNRFVISEHQIVSLDISENPPPYTAVQVNGVIGNNQEGLGFVDPPGTLNASLTGAGGGNAVTSAYAVDYDMWYQYGFRAPNSVSAPWASDPDSQCAPFAVALLNQARKQIFSGSMTINGWNEFYQAGDVIYLEDYDMLFYVSSVSHAFSYSGQLSTSLQLTYGHNPGEYIPTHLDLIGKHLYTTQTFSEAYRSSRHSVVGDDTPIGSIVVNKNNQDLESILVGPNGKHNRAVLGKLLYGATGALNPSHLRNTKPVLQLRVYTDGDEASEIRTAVENIRDYLLSPSDFSTVNSKLIGDTEVKTNFKLEPSAVEMTEIDILNDQQSPSSSAWNLVRMIERSGVSGTSNLNGETFISSESAAQANAQAFNSTDVPTELDDILKANIIDAWVTFKTVDETIETSDQTNQAAQESNAAVSNAQSERLT